MSKVSSIQNMAVGDRIKTNQIKLYLLTLLLIGSSATHTTFAYVTVLQRPSRCIQQVFRVTTTSPIKDESSCTASRLTITSYDCLLTGSHNFQRMKLWKSSDIFETRLSCGEERQTQSQLKRRAGCVTAKMTFYKRAFLLVWTARTNNFTTMHCTCLI